MYKQRLMIVGADVTHSSPGAGDQSRKESIAAVVASMDPNCSQYSKFTL